MTMVHEVSAARSSLGARLSSALRPVLLPLRPARPDSVAILRALLFAIAIGVVAWLGIVMTHYSDRIAAVWLANGIAVALLLRRPCDDRVLLFGAGFAGNVAANLVAGDTLVAALLLSVLNSLEIALVVALTARRLAPDGVFESAAIGRFITAALIGPLPGSLISAAWLAWQDGAPVVTSFASWYGNDALGLMIVAPILLAIRRGRPDDHIRREVVLSPLVAAALTAFVFSQGGKPLLFVLTPIALLGAFRLRLLPAVLTVAAIAVSSIFYTAQGFGPIATSAFDPVERIYILQAFLATLVMLVLPVAAIIGERDRLGVAADHSERLFQRIARATPAGILHLELGGDVAFANDRWLELTDSRPASFASDSWLDIIQLDDRTAARSMWDCARTLQQPAGGDVRYLAPDGTVRWAELSFYPELSAGRLLGYVVKLFDVSNRHKVEDALQESEELYRLLAENSSDVIVRLTLDGTARYVSSAARRLFGLDPADIVERPLARFVHPADLDAFNALFPGVNSDRGEANAQFRHRRLNGDFIWLEASARTTIDRATGAPIEIIVSLRDISARRQSETIAASAAAKLAETNRLLTLAEGVAEVGHWRFDIATQTLDCSPQVNMITDFAGDQTFGPTAILALVHPADRRALLRTLLTASRRREPAQQGARLLLADEMRHVRLVALAEYDDAGALTGLFGVIQDVTENEIAQAELIRTRNEAQAAAHAKGDFLSTMSHEIRTPMTGVLGMIDLLRDNPPAGERERYLVTLKQSADLLMTVLDDVLDFSRIESGLVEFEDGDFDIEELMQATIALFEGAASQKGLLLGVEIDRGATTRVRGDAVRLQQVVSNLLSNSIKFTVAGRVTLLLSALPAETRADDAAPDPARDQAHNPTRQRWRIEVRDTGIGIAADKLGSLFDPFVQAEAATSRRFGGTGLGLAISRRLIDAMGGEAGVHSHPGCGSTFWLEVPLPVGSDAEHFDIPANCNPDSRALDLLVAEDNPVNQMIIGAILGRLGHRVTCVENGRLALELATARAFDAILMDMQMPEMDGLATTRAIRNLPAPHGTVPIIALTADASSERRRFYDGAGLTDFLTKPIDRRLLAERLDAIAAVRAPTSRAPDPADLSVEPLDVTRYHELRASLSGAQIHDLLGLLLTELDRSPARIRLCLARGDFAAARAEAHSLKGAASNMGAIALGRVAAAIESAATDAAFAPELVALDVQARRTVKAIAALR
jgi:PAS domain S-box-containing protein